MIDTGHTNSSARRPGHIKTVFEQTAAYYATEINGLAALTRLPAFDSLLDRLMDYPGFLKSRKRLANPLRPILAASGGTRIIDTWTQSREIREALGTAHLAACCELLQGSRLPREQMHAEALTRLAGQYLTPYRNADEAILTDASNRLHTMDAVRTMHLLRALGLVTRPTGAFFQLGLGTGSGFKDMHSLHKLPSIRHEDIAGKDVYVFRTVQEKVAHIVVSDPDPQHQEYYRQLNRQESPLVLALNQDAGTVLANLPASGIRKRNLVTAIRIDHRMIPDIPQFLGLLGPCIDEQCDLVISMGSGDNPEAFEGRIQVLAGLFHALEDSGHRPVLIKLHGPGTLIQQHDSLYLGNPMSGTYQILHCRLQRKRLLKSFRSPAG